MGKVIRNALCGLLVVAFLIFAGAMMNKSAKLLEHWAYPTVYTELVEEKSIEYNVPLSVIYAVIRAESNFELDAESWVGARGLMQLTKESYEWIDYYRGPTGATWNDFYLADVNVDYGVWLLSYLYDLFGEWETVYAAYNAGPNAVKKWLENPEYSLDGKNYEFYNSYTMDCAGTTRQIIPATYVRLKSLEIGYTLPKNVANAIGIDNGRVFVSGYNIFTICDKLLKGADPERIEGAWSAGLTYPLMRTITLGVNVNF